MTRLLLLQITAHLISDFYLQNAKSCRDKANNAFKSKHLYIHSSITFIFAYALSTQAGFWWAALLIAALHCIIDGLKGTYGNKIPWSFFIDQLLHFIVIVCITSLYEKYTAVVLPSFIPQTNVLLWSIAFIFCIQPANFFIHSIFSNAHLSIPPTLSDNGIPTISTPKEEGLPNAGKVIGITERILTLIFMLLGQYEAIGFLLAAKSLLRLKDDAVGKSEYVLVGTLLSFGMAIVAGAIVIIFG